MIGTITPYTPGPWSVADAPTLQTGDCQLTHQVWGRQRICFIEGQNVGLTVAAANAHLIAAAPDLLAALKDAARDIPEPEVDLMCHVGITTMERCGRCQRAERIYAAIEKAEGR